MSERKIDSENIWGREFRVPSVVGEGSGRGFQFSGLHIPKDWDTISDKIKIFKPANLQSFFEDVCERFQQIPGSIIFDSKTGILKSLSIKTKPVSSLKLDTEFPNQSEGIYQGENVKNLKTAIALQRTAGSWLWYLWHELDPKLSQYYGLIDGDPGSYYSRGLEIPREFLESEESVSNDYFRERFQLNASNIAGRFGLTLRTMHFNEKGILHSYDIEEGNGCCYFIDSGNRGRYIGHNVDTPVQAAVLHGIGASFINSLFQQKFHGYY
ncbi:MAG: hypothetical protein Q7R97_04295 [Candidatus Daviesbacteria bacterium]|nr:hypothetical protein [Candidatus Daviesbacteria bacterium]